MSVLRFSEARCREVETAGGKGASLARMAELGLPVPPGFVVQAAALAESLSDGGDELRGVLAEGAGERAAERAQELVQAIEPSPELIEAVGEAHAELGDEVHVAVRSSACAEDSETASYAGQQETYLHVRGAEAVMDRVRDCWASFFSERALFYRERKGSLEDIADRSQALADGARISLGEALESMTDRFAEQSAESIERGLREHTREAIEQLEASAERAGAASRDAALQLRDQLAVVNELAGNLEHRVAHARRRAEEQVDNDFARRMALIAESLNSSAIDISKAFDNDVADTAWSSYLRGDRGIFTRRAVRLLDNQQAREVSEIYRADADFRETVNRYIHDFEAMLRSVLSTRDGHALGVTLLSSDPGKLYVALAQSIDRLRD